MCKANWLISGHMIFSNSAHWLKIQYWAIYFNIAHHHGATIVMSYGTIV